MDDLARPLLLGARVHRIVSLAPSCTECLLAIGGGERLVGIDDHSDFPEPLTAVVRVGGFKNIDLVRVTRLAPDLVVAASLHAVSFLPRLETHGTRVFVMMPRTVDGIVDGMARLASVLGLAAEAAPYLASCRTRIATVVDRTLPRRRRPLTYVEYSPEGHTGGPQSFLDDLVVKAGGVNLGGVARVEWPVLAPATVRRFDPDAIVIATYPGGATRDSLVTRPGWDRLTAVKSGRVWELPARMVKRPGPGVLDGLERLEEVLSAAG